MEPGIGDDGNEITITTPSGPLFSTFLPPELGGGRVIAGVAYPTTNTGLSEEGVLYGPSTVTITGSGGLKARDQLPPVIPTTNSIPGKNSSLFAFAYHYLC